MYNNCDLGCEIIRVTVENGRASDYIEFESNLTKLLNKRYPQYHCGADIYQLQSDCNSFFIIALYNTGIRGVQKFAADLERYVKAQYSAYFPYVVSRTITTEACDNILVDHTFHDF